MDGQLVKEYKERFEKTEKFQVGGESMKSGMVRLEELVKRVREGMWSFPYTKKHASQLANVITNFYHDPNPIPYEKALAATTNYYGADNLSDQLDSKEQWNGKALAKIIAQELRKDLKRGGFYGDINSDVLQILNSIIRRYA